jgi:hypothetical protein
MYRDRRSRPVRLSLSSFVSLARLPDHVRSAARPISVL